jgi:hypothetical protein
VQESETGQGGWTHTPDGWVFEAGTVDYSDEFASYVIIEVVKRAGCQGLAADAIVDALRNRMLFGAQHWPWRLRGPFVPCVPDSRTLIQFGRHALPEYFDGARWRNPNAKANA